MTTPTTVNVRLQLRADTAANWTAANPILLANEVGLETDTKKLKVGNGSSAWNSLAYFPSIVSGGTVLGNLEIGSTGTLTFEGSTADGFETTLAVTNPTADRTITLPNQSGTVVVSGNASIVNADIAANAEIAVSKLANGTANQVIVTDGTNVSWSDDLTLAGNLTVNGTTTTINTQDLVVEDKNIILGNVDIPSDVTADGGGITLKGATDKTITWVDATDAWTSSERFSVPLGSAASPSVTFTGDEDSGVYSPGSDQVAIATGGAGRLFVDASGNVGVGNSSPGATLHLLSNNPEIRLTDGDSGNPDHYISGSGGTLYLKVDDNNEVADSTFRVAIDGSERLRIGSDGGVGIGATVTSAYGLRVGKAPDAATYSSIGNVFSANTATTTACYGTASFIGAAANAGTPYTVPVIQHYRASQGTINADATVTSQFGFAATGTLIGATNNYGFFGDIPSGTGRFNVYMQGTANNYFAGNVGIGTINPGALLHLSSATGSATPTPTELRIATTTNASDWSLTDPWGRISFYSADTSGAGPKIHAAVDVIKGTTAAGASSGFQFKTTDGGADTLNTRMTITPGGNVGIGTTSPATKLHVLESASPAAACEVRAGNITSRCSLLVRADGDGEIQAPNGNLIFNTNAGERARIDSFGRLLIGTSSSLGAGYQLQVAGTNDPTSSLSLHRYQASANGSIVELLKSRGAQVGTDSVVSSGDVLGRVVAKGYDSVGYTTAARIDFQVDGTPGANDMPGRIVLSTTLDGASSATERLRITNDGVQCYNQAAPVSYAAAATLVVGDLKNGIIQYTGAAATLTLPTGTLTEGGFSGIYTNMTFEWSVINTGSGTCTIGGGTGHTIVGAATVTAGASGRFASRRTAANTFVSYRLS